MRALAAAACLGVLVLAFGCGRNAEETPSACLQGPQPYLTALQGAPGKVLVGGESEIGSCLVPDQEAGELSRVGAALVEVATDLNARARSSPEGAAALRLGYLIGAVEEGAEDTSGIHTDLVRRLRAAAELNPGGEELPTPIRDGYQRGIESGREGG